MALATIILVACGEAVAESSRRQRIESIYRSYFPAILEASPDGSKLLLKDVGRSGFELSVLELRTQLRTVVDLSARSQLNPRWSHDGSRIAYSVEESGESEIRVVELVKGTTEVIAKSLSPLTGLAWSSDDSGVSFIQQEAGTRLLQFAASHTTPRPLAALSRLSEYSWSPAGSIAFASKAEPNTLTFLSTTDTPPPRNVPMGGELSALSWSADGRKVAVAVRRNDDDFPTLAAVDVASGSVRWINNPQAEISAIQFGPFNDRFAFSALREARRSASLAQLTSGSTLSVAPNASVSSVIGFATGPERMLVVENQRNETKSDLIEWHNDGTRKLAYSTPGGLRDKFVSTRLEPNGKRRAAALLWTDKHAARGTRPLLIMIHGGPNLSYLQALRPELEVFLEFGIDVLQLNYLGSSGYGARYASEVSAAVDDVVDAVQLAAEESGYQRQKIFLFGDSYGAGLTLKAAERLGELGGVILISYLGDVDGTARMPKRLLAFHGEWDRVRPPAAALKSLQQRWQLPLEPSPVWWRLVPAEGHSFRDIGRWSAVLDEVVGLVTQ